MKSEINGAAALPHLGVIRARGDEAAKFLHNQLTQDFLLMTPAEARLAAFCTAKGRMLASFVAIKRSSTEILLICHQDLLEATLKRMSMFVLRSKVQLDDASTQFDLFGLVGDAVGQAVGTALAPWAHQQKGDVSIVGLYPDGATPRALRVAPAGAAAPALECVDAEVWRRSEVRSGVVLVSAATSEAFVPQMLNYESVGGVSFKKGCYPGQEVVARSQFRGTLKRRAFLMRSASPMAAGDTLFSPDDAGQPCATVVQAAADTPDGFVGLVSGQIAAMQAPQLHLRSADGPVAHASAVPYPLLEDI